MTTRRRFLKHAAAAGAIALLPRSLSAEMAAAIVGAPQTPSAAPIPMGHGSGSPASGFQVRPFADPLKVPPVLRPRPGETLEIAMSAFKQKLHSQLPETPLWGYQGTYPGPTIEVQSGTPLRINWTSRLPTKHFLPIDHTIHGADASKPEVRTVVHLHGAKVLPEHDGYPDAWFTSDGITGPAFKAGPSVYPNDQPATALWYHDHAIGITRLNMYAGLVGMYLIRDATERDLNLPSGEYEIPLIIQDRLFNADGTLLYPTIEATHPIWISELFGDTILVNGVAFPYLEVEPRKYRLRMLNASNARFYHMTFAEADEEGNPTGRPGPLVFQIGSDLGLLPWLAQPRDLLMGPAERFDIIVNFSDFAGRNVVITNDDVVPSDDGPAATLGSAGTYPPRVMLFKVTKPLQAPDKSALPTKLKDLELLNVPNVTIRRLTISEVDRASDGFPVVGMLGGKMWDDPVTEKPRAGATELWDLINLTGDTHPVHIHLVRFQVVYRQVFDRALYDRTGEIRAVGETEVSDASERNAMKDTVKTFPGTVTRIIVRFDLPKGTPVQPGKAYRYVWHCNVLEHEDNEMMRPYDVIG